MSRLTGGAMTRRGLARIVGGAATGGALAGVTACGTAQQGAGPIQALAPAEMEFIHHWGPATPGGQGWQAIVDRFQKANPGVTVRQTVQASGGLLEKLVTTAASGTPPTMSDLSPAHYAAAVPRGLLVKLDPFIKAGRGVKREALLPSVLDVITVDGSISALPSQSGARLLYYNEDLLGDVGVKAPDPSWRWDREFLDAARRATRDTGAPETQRFGAESAQGWPWYMPVWAYGGDLLTKDRKRCGLSEPAAIEALQFGADVTHRWRVTPNAAALATSPGGAFFDSGRLAFLISGHAAYAQLQPRLTFKWGVMQLPQGSAGSKTAFDMWLSGVASGAKHHDAAFAFLSYALQPENYLEFLKYASWMPPIKGPERSPLVANAQHWTAMAGAMSGAKLPPLLPQTDEIVKVMTDGLAPVFGTGEQTARTATSALCTKVEALLGSGR